MGKKGERAGTELGRPVAGGVVVCGMNVLLLRKPSEGEYRLPKGKRERGESVLETALRETREESGYEDLRFLAPLGTRTVAFQRNEKWVERRESYVLLSLEPERQNERGEGEDKFEPIWMPFSEAIDTLTFESERRWARLGLEALRDAVPNGSQP